MNKNASESDLAEANFEKFILDFSRENKLVSEIIKSNETLEKINQDSLSKTKQKVEETLQSNTQIKQRLKEIDEFSLEEEETLKQMKELKTQGLEDLSHQESEYHEIYNKTQNLIESTQKRFFETSEKQQELEKKLLNKQNSLFLYISLTRINWKKDVEISPKSNSVLGYLLRENGLPKPIVLSPEELPNKWKNIWKQMTF